MDLSEFSLDRSVFTVGTFDDDDAPGYWRTRSPEDRLAALEFLRRMMYGYDPVADRIQKTLEFDELELR
jgi:hypothetical protein